jgi:hypothetical protein
MLVYIYFSGHDVFVLFLPFCLVNRKGGHDDACRMVSKTKALLSQKKIVDGEEVPLTCCNGAGIVTKS